MVLMTPCATAREENAGEAADAVCPLKGCFRQMSTATTTLASGRTISSCKLSSCASESDSEGPQVDGVSLDRSVVVAAVCRAVRSCGHAASLADFERPDDAVLLEVSEPFAEMSGYATHELLGKSTRLLSSGCEDETDPVVWAGVRQAGKSGCELSASTVNRHKCGWLYWNNMHMRGLEVGIDASRRNAMRFVLTLHRGCEDEVDDDDRSVMAASMRMEGEALLGDIHKEITRVASIHADGNAYYAEFV